MVWAGVKKNTFDNYPKFESLVNFQSPQLEQSQLTLDNLNLLGKSKKVRVIGSSKQITGNKEMDGEGIQPDEVNR